MAATSPERDLEELDRAHGKFDLSLHLYMTWLQDAFARRDKATGFDRVKLEGMVVLAEKAAAVFSVSAFEAFIRAAVALAPGAPPETDLHSLADLEAMLRRAWDVEVGRVIMKRSEYLDLLLTWRGSLIHQGDVPGEGFRKRLEKIYGPQVAASWTPEAPQFPGPGGLQALFSNLAECEFLIYNELRARLHSKQGS